VSVRHRHDPASDLVPSRSPDFGDPIRWFRPPSSFAAWRGRRFLARHERERLELSDQLRYRERRQIRAVLVLVMVVVLGTALLGWMIWR